MFFDEPSRGVDVQAKPPDLRHHLGPGRAQGWPSIFVSTELEELLEVADRILVMRHGRIVAEVMPERDHALRALPLCMQEGAQTGGMSDQVMTRRRDAMPLALIKPTRWS